MKCSQKVTFNFNPNESDIPALSDRIGRILWACIKTGHITSQYFNDHIAATALRIEMEKPKDYEQFKDLIKRSPLQNFGTLRDPKQESRLTNWMILDDEFWKGMWYHITKKTKLEIIINEN